MVVLEIHRLHHPCKDTPEVMDQQHIQVIQLVAAAVLVRLAVFLKVEAKAVLVALVYIAP
jgi:hypothetical protein